MATLFCSSISSSMRSARLVREAGGNYDLILSTGAWGRNILIPGAIASIATLGVGATKQYMKILGYPRRTIQNRKNNE
jgi:hypothetical protein